MQPPEEHFQKIEAILQKHSQAIEAEIRSLQQADETARWSLAWKRIYNWRFSNAFVRQKIFRNWAARCCCLGNIAREVLSQSGKSGRLDSTQDEKKFFTSNYLMPTADCRRG